MKIDSKWRNFLGNESELLEILASDAPVPDFPGEQATPAHRLYQTASVVQQLLHGDFDAAGALLAEINQEQPPLGCHELAAIWLQAETENAGQAWRRLDAWIKAAQAAAAMKRPRRLPVRQIADIDRQLALHWAPVLRLYLTTLLEEWDNAVLEQFRLDRSAAVEAGVSLYILSRIDIMQRLARSRQERDVGGILTAVEEWSRFCRQNPTCGTGDEYMLDAVLALEYDNRFAEALDWIERSLAGMPDQYDMLLIKARVLKRTGDVQGSLKVCDELIERFPDDFSGYCLRSNASFLLGRYDQAMQDARRACEVAPDNPNSYMARAFVHMQLNHYEAALQDFNQTLEKDPENYDALRGQGKCLSMLGRDYDALASFNAMRRSYPDDPDIYYELADVLFSAGYLEECEKICRKCLQLDDAYVSAYVILGMIAIRRNEDDLAHGLLTRAVELEPDNPFALNELAYLIHLEGDDDTALELVNRALAESDDYADAICNKGVILYYRSEFEQAAAAFTQTLNLVPDHVSAWIGRGNTLTQLCEFDEAQRCYDSALLLDPESADACHGKAVLYRMLGLDEEVRKWQERALLLDPDIEDD